MEGKNLNSKLFTAEALATLINGRVRQGGYEQVLARLVGTVENLLATSGAVLGRIYLQPYRDAVKELKVRLGLQAFKSAVAEGQLLDLQQALVMALDLIQPLND